MTSIRSPICQANRAGGCSGNHQYDDPETGYAVPSNIGGAAAVRNEFSPGQCTGAIQAITQDEIILVSTCDLRMECDVGRAEPWPATCGRGGRRRNSGSVSHNNNKTTTTVEKCRSVLVGSPPYIGRGKPPTKLTADFRPNPTKIRPCVFPVFYRGFSRPRVRPNPTKLVGRTDQPSDQLRPTFVLGRDKQEPQSFTREVITVVGRHDPPLNR